MKRIAFLFFMLMCWTVEYCYSAAYCCGIAYCYGSISAEPEEIIEKNIEEILQDGSEEIEQSVEFLEILQELKANPININTASARELQILYFLSSEQIEAIIRYRSDYGQINGIYELYYIPFFNEKIASAIEPYIYFGSEDKAKWTLGSALKKGKHSAIFRYGQVLAASKAYKENIYAGSPAALLARYNFKFSDNLRVGLALEKDAGEKGVDFFSGYVDFGGGGYGSGGGSSGGGSGSSTGSSSGGAKILKQWIIGTYKASFGYGL
ncbi:MAG: helix-hairpin-helix domain-containing protein, partial [Bacteroidales bacterium]|nr:helix-hairpin-helix domain-containing protein [Bacteroidales bacterium]